MDAEQLTDRTKQLALRIIRWCEALPRNRTTDVIARQLLRAGTSVGANYRSECRARSRADFVSEMGIVEEEADEVAYWIELPIDSGQAAADRVEPLRVEAGEVTAIAAASRKTARSCNTATSKPTNRRSSIDSRQSK